MKKYKGVVSFILLLIFILFTHFSGSNSVHLLIQLRNKYLSSYQTLHIVFYARKFYEEERWEAMSSFLDIQYIVWVCKLWMNELRVWSKHIFLWLAVCIAHSFLHVVTMASTNSNRTLYSLHMCHSFHTALEVPMNYTLSIIIS